MVWGGVGLALLEIYKFGVWKENRGVLLQLASASRQQSGCYTGVRFCRSRKCEYIPGRTEQLCSDQLRS